MLNKRVKLNDWIYYLSCSLMVITMTLDYFLWPHWAQLYSLTLGRWESQYSTHMYLYSVYFSSWLRMSLHLLRSGACMCVCVCMCQCGHVLLEYADLCGAVSLSKDMRTMAKRVAGSLAVHQTAIFCWLKTQAKVTLHSSLIVNLHTCLYFVIRINCPMCQHTEGSKSLNSLPETVLFHHLWRPRPNSSHLVQFKSVCS